MADSTTWLLIFLLLYWAYCFFWGIRAMRRAHTASDYFIAGRQLSPWVFSLAVTAVTLAGWAFMGHPGLVFRDGFQFVNTSFYGIAVALAGVVLLKRQWMLGRRFGYMTSGEMFADYFHSNALCILSVGIALLFGIPFVAILFGASGFVISELTNRAISRDVAMWVLSGFVLLYSVTGGMQAVAKIAVVQFVLFAFGVIVLGTFALKTVGGFDALNMGLANIGQNLSGFWGSTNGSGGGDFPGYFAIPGVIQWTAGLGVEAPSGGPWTAIMCLTFMMSVMGIQASPVISMWGFSSQSPRGFAIHQVWGAAFCGGIIMLLFATILGISAHLLGANSEVNAAGITTARLLPVLASDEGNMLVPLFIKLIAEDQPWLIGVFAVCAIAALQATAGAFMSTTGSILARDIYKRYIRPDADSEKQKLVGRLCTGLVFLAALLLATYSMDATLLLGSLAISCGFQLWPSLLAVTWFPWITRQAATLGLIVGLIAVVMTEPLGQRLAADSLPWGRWPWTIHSAAWGMFFNLIACLMVSAMGRSDSDRPRRNGFHQFLNEYSTLTVRRRWSKPVAGVIVLVWMFFAIGPGAVIGNIFFGEPNAGYEAWNFGMPSIWAWQIIWWALGVGMIWYLAYKMEMSTVLEQKIERVSGDS
jgi:SSS family solute:Na+ symporter